MKKLLLLLFFSLFLGIKSSYSTHVMGMDISWKCLGNDTYEMKLVVYRRCTDGASSLSLNNSSLGASLFSIKSDSCFNTYNVTGTIVSNSYVVDDITPVCNNGQKPCPISGGSGSSTTQVPVGVERHTIKYKIYLGGSYQNCCWYKIHWELCCRNSNITTGYADANFYSESWLNRCAKPCDNGPDFKNPPVAILCAGQDFCYNQGVVDIDNDSLSYSMAPPLGGSFSSPWSYTYPLTTLGGNSPCPTCNPPTGFNLYPDGTICFRPMQVQIGVLKIMVTEWRKDSLGVYQVIGKTARDMQFVVIQNCNNKLPSLSGPFTYEACADQQICITIRTNDQDLSDTTRIFWNKGIPNATWNDDNGNSKHATGVLCWTPSESDASTLPYYFTATVNDDHCPLPGSSSRSYAITVKPTPKNTRTYTKGKCGLYTFSCAPSSSYFNGSTYKWYVPKLVGTGVPTVVYSNTQTTTYKFTQGGKYLVKNTMFFNGCTNTYFDTLIVDTLLKVKCYSDSFICFGKPLNVWAETNPIYSNVKYLWSTNDTTKLINVNPTTPTYYYVTVIDKDSCTTTDSIYLNIDPNKKLQVVFPNYGKKCVNNNKFYLSCLLKIQNNIVMSAKEKWYCTLIPNALDTNDNSFSYNVPGKYWITYEGESVEGCVVKDSVQIEIVPPPLVFAGADKYFCTNYNIPFSLDTMGNPFGGSWKVIDNNYITYPLDSGLTFGGKYSYRFNVGNVGPNGGICTLVYTYKDILPPNCINSDTVTFEVITIPNVDAGRDTTICVSTGVVNLNQLFKPNFAVGKWYGNGVLSDSSSFSSYINTSTSIQTYKLYFKVNVMGCENFDSVLLTIKPIPTLLLNLDKNNVCQNGSPINVTTFPNPGKLYLDSNEIFSTSINVNSLDTGYHTITYSYTDSVCVNTISTKFYVELPSNITVDRVLNKCFDNAIDSGFTIVYHINKPYRPVFSNPLQTTQLNDSTIVYFPSVTEQNQKYIKFYIKTTGTLYCPNDSVSVEAMMYNEPLINFNTDKKNGCTPLSVNFYDSTLYNDSATYFWDFGDGTSSNNINPNHIYIKSGVYTITLTVTNKYGCSTTMIKQDYIESYPIPKADFTFVPDSTDWATVALPKYKFWDKTISPKYPITNYLWEFGDGKGISITNNPEYIYSITNPDLDTGWYVITLRVISSVGCIDYIQKRIYIGPDLTVFVPNAFTPDDNNTNEKFKSVCSGIKTFEMYIFNRWGEKLYYSDDYKSHGWDGKFKGVECQMDVYIYKIIVTSKDDKRHEYNGTVHLIR